MGSLARAFALSLALGACGVSPSVPVDAASPARADASSALPVLGQAGPTDVEASLPVRLDCPALDPPGEVRDTTLQLFVFTAPGAAIGIADVCLLDAGDPGIDCRGSCAARASPAGASLAMLPLAISSRVDLCAASTREGVMPILLTHAFVSSEPMPTIGATTIDQSIVDSVRAEFGVPLRTTETATLGGRVLDCDGHDTFGAEIRVFDERGELARDPGTDPGFVSAYLFDQTFSRDQRHTNGLGVFGVGNLRIAPDTVERVRVEAWGVRSAGAAPTRIACAVARVRAGMFTQVDLTPYPTDDAPGQPCALP